MAAVWGCSWLCCGLMKGLQLHREFIKRCQNQGEFMLKLKLAAVGCAEGLAISFRAYQKLSQPGWRFAEGQWKSLKVYQTLPEKACAVLRLRYLHQRLAPGKVYADIYLWTRLTNARDNLRCVMFEGSPSEATTFLRPHLLNFQSPGLPMEYGEPYLLNQR